MTEFQGGDGTRRLERIEIMEQAEQQPHYKQIEVNSVEKQRALCRARRTAFVARFIVLREGKRTKAHRIIEMMEWNEESTPEELYERFRKVFVENGDNMVPVDRDLRRALAHSARSLHYFIHEYEARSTSNFIEALYDYERSNKLLFGDDEQPKPGGWRLPQELERTREREKASEKNRD